MSARARAHTIEVADVTERAPTEARRCLPSWAIEHAIDDARLREAPSPPRCTDTSSG
ncbi:hypothetical protein AB0K68_20280 [Streptomyces sp. NPDC050698]